MPNKKTIRSILFLLGVGFIPFLLWHSRDVLANHIANINWGIFIVSILLALLSNIIASLLYFQLLKKYGVQIDYPIACEMFFYAQITKYIPGKIWSLWYQSAHLTHQHAFTSILFANIDLTLIIIILVSAISLGLLFINVNIWWLAIAVIIISIFISNKLLFSCKTFAILKQIIHYLKRLGVKECTCVPIRHNPNSMLYTFVFSISYASAYILMLYAIFNFNLDTAFNYAGYLGLSWIIGILVFITPGGMGIRELFFILLAKYLDADISLELLAAIAAISRVWLIMIEISGILLIVTWRYYNSSIKIRKGKL